MGIGIILLIVFGLLIVAFMVVGYRLPSEQVVQAEIIVPEPVDVVFSYISQIKHWPEWRLMPEMIKGKSIHFSGQDGEKGASVNWKSEDADGSIEFLELIPGKGIAYRFSLGKKKGMMDCFLEMNPDGKQTRLMNKAVLSGGNMPATRILAWMMGSVVRKDLLTSLQRLRTALGHG